MGKRDRPVFHDVMVLGEVAPVRQWLQLAWVLLGLAVLCPFFVPRWEAWAPMLLAVGCAAGIRRRLRGEFLGYRLDEQGLTRVASGGRDEQTWPWESIRSVEPRLMDLLIRTDTGDLVIGDGVPTWPALGRELQRALVEYRSERGQPLRPSRIEGWLAIPRHGALTVTSGPLRAGEVLKVVGGFALAALWLSVKTASPVLLPAAARPLVWAGLAVAAVATIFFMARDVRLTADATGLLVRCGRRTGFHPWDQITGASLGEETGASLLIETAHGIVTCPRPGRGAQQLHHAIEQMQAAREDGARLPRDAGVPETALSIAEASAPVDRGLSRET